jgi:hypothetical protein
MNSVNTMLEGLHETGRIDDFEQARNRDFVEGPCLVPNATKETLMQRVRQAQGAINHENRAMAFCLDRLAEMEG